MMDTEIPETQAAEPQEPEKTQPPVSALRFETPFELYREMPQVGQLTIHRPRPDEDVIAFVQRLRASTTPEDAVTFISFAALPKMAVWWGYECLRIAADELPQSDHKIMELVADWINYPENENRYRVAQAALFAPVKTPGVFLGLAVAWSGGAIAPNDAAPVPAYRSPRATNSAVLSCLARANLSQRSERLARFIAISKSLFGVF